MQIILEMHGIYQVPNTLYNALKKYYGIGKTDKMKIVKVPDQVACELILYFIAKHKKIDVVKHLQTLSEMLGLSQREMYSVQDYLDVLNGKGIGVNLYDLTHRWGEYEPTKNNLQAETIPASVFFNEAIRRIIEKKRGLLASEYYDEIKQVVEI